MLSTSELRCWAKVVWEFLQITYPTRWRSHQRRRLSQGSYKATARQTGREKSIKAQEGRREVNEEILEGFRNSSSYWKGNIRGAPYRVWVVVERSRLFGWWYDIKRTFLPNTDEYTSPSWSWCWSQGRRRHGFDEWTWPRQHSINCVATNQRLPGPIYWGPIMPNHAKVEGQRDLWWSYCWKRRAKIARFAPTRCWQAKEFVHNCLWHLLWPLSTEDE